MKAKGRSQRNSGKRPKTGGRDWRPGQSGNPRGAPVREETWGQILKRIGATRIGTAKSALTLKEAVARRMYRLAVDGDVRAVRWIAEREEGLPAQDVTLGGKVFVVRFEAETDDVYTRPAEEQPLHQ